MTGGSPTARTAEAVEGGVDSRGAPVVERRSDAEGCACLECRPVDATALRRSLLDALGWSVRLCLSRPSVVLLVLALVAGRRLLEAVSLLPPPAAETLHGVTTFALLFVLRGHVGTVAAGELTGDRVTPVDAARRALARTPALVGLAAVFVWLLLFTSSVAITPVVALFFAASYLSLPWVVPAASVVVPLAIAGPLLFVAFRCWFAVEACVVGRYGPIGSVRVSWALTSNHPWKLLLALLPVVGAGVAAAVGLGPGGDLSPFTAGPVLDALATSAGELTSVVWYAVYAHLYVQGAVDG